MMELSILQHPKDNNPRAVSIGAVVDMIRAGSWPAGYPPILLVQGVFEGGTKQADIIRMSGLAVSCFPPRDGSNLSELRQAARDDPHTLLMFGNVDEGLTVIYAHGGIELTNQDLITFLARYTNLGSEASIKTLFYRYKQQIHG